MSDPSEYDLPFRSIEIEGRVCILELDRKHKGRFVHVASFYDATAAQHYVDFRNDNIDPLPLPAEDEEVQPKQGGGLGALFRGDPVSDKVPAFTVADAERRLNDTDAMILRFLRSKLNGGDTVAMSHGDMKRMANEQNQVLNHGSIGHSIAKLARFGLIMLAKPSVGHEPAVYQIARTRLINT